MLAAACWQSSAMDGKGKATSSRRRFTLLQQRLHGQDAVHFVIERLHFQC
jgi:hypothetical protein